MKKLIYKDISSEDFGLVIQTPPTYEFPDRDVESIHVPGRNGDLVIDNKCYKNVIKSYNLAKGFTSVKHLVPNAEQVLTWLTSSNGKYVRLEDDYDPDVYRLATYNQSGSFVNYYDEALSLIANFDCKPQRYLKEGDIPVNIKHGNEYFIINDYQYETLPLLKIYNIDKTNQILMITVENQNGDDIANVTFKDLSYVSPDSQTATVYIDSDLQNCYNEDNKDVNEYINFNGKNFPTLQDGKTKIKISNFEEERAEIPSYNSLISAVQTKCESKYEQLTDYEKSKQESVYVKSYKSLIDSKKSIYDHISYQALAEEKADDYIFESFNTLLSMYYVQQYTFKDDYSGAPEWLTITQSDDTITVKAAVDGFFITNNSDDSGKKILYLTSGSTITSTRGNITLTITYYEKDNIIPIKIKEHSSSTLIYERDPSDDFKRDDGKYYAWKNSQSSSILFSKTEYVDVDTYLYSKNGDNPPTQTTYVTSIEDRGAIKLKVKYEDIPDWLRFEIEYDTAANKYSPKKLKYIINKTGFYWNDTSWYEFGKSKWNYYSNAGNDIILDELSWDTISKAFKSLRTLSFSKTKTFEYRYFATIADVQYDDPNSEGIPSNIVIEKIDNELKQVQLKSKRPGYYSVDDHNWQYKDQNANIVVLKGTDSFSISYLENIPNYSEEKDWPDWLNPQPEDYNGSANLVLNASNISFKVSKTSNYRASYTIKETNDTYSLWVQINNGSYLLEKRTESQTASKLSRASDESFYVNQIYTIPEADSRPVDRGFYYGGGDSKNPPTWLNYKIFINIKLLNDDVIKRCEKVIPNDIDSGKITIGEHTYYEYIEVDDDTSLYVRDKWDPDYDATIYGIINSEPIRIGNVYQTPQIEYYVNQNGYFKWNSNTVWFRKESSVDTQPFLTTDYKESSIFYYMNTLPEYSNDPTQPNYNPMHDYIDLVHEEDENGNPVRVVFTVKENAGGYFKIDYNVNWEKYKDDSVLTTAVVSKLTIVNHLNKINDITDANIEVTPRWWKL